MRDPHSRRVWLDRCPKCKSIWFDAGEPDAAAGRELPFTLSNEETPAPCPVCHVPLSIAKLSHANVLACARCRGVHIAMAQLDAVEFIESGDEPTLRPPAMFECAVCTRTFSLDQGDGVTCRACAPSPSLGGGANLDTSAERRQNTIGLTGLIDFILFR